MTNTLPALGTVVCAVDDAFEARAVLYAAAGLTQAPGSRLIALRVDARATDETAALKAAADLEAFVSESVPGMVAYQARTDLVVRAGKPADVIVEVAREYGASLIVMGTHGRGRVGRTVFGSTAEQVLQRATVPVAIVPPALPEIVSLTPRGPVPHFGIILVAVDLQAPADRQLALAAAFSGGSVHRLFLVHAYPEGSNGSLALEMLKRVSTTVQSAHGTRLLAKEGDPVDTIVKIVETDEVGLIILGRDRTRGGRIACELLHRTGAVVVVVP